MVLQTKVSDVGIQRIQSRIVKSNFNPMIGNAEIPFASILNPTLWPNKVVLLRQLVSEKNMGNPTTIFRRRRFSNVRNMFQIVTWHDLKVSGCREHFNKNKRIGNWTIDKLSCVWYCIWTMTITRKSPLTGKVTTMDLNITEGQILLYESGVLLQNAFPQLTADEREFYKTGLTPEDWKAMFGE